MKKVVTGTLGSSKQDLEFKTQFLGQSFPVRRMGADQDTGKAWELMRRQQATADAIGLGEIPDHYQVRVQCGDPCSGDDGRYPAPHVAGARGALRAKGVG